MTAMATSSNHTSGVVSDRPSAVVSPGLAHGAGSACEAGDEFQQLGLRNGPCTRGRRFEGQAKGGGITRAEAVHPLGKVVDRGELALDGFDEDRRTGVVRVGRPCRIHGRPSG